MFEAYKLENIVKNRDILKKFDFEIELYEGYHLLKATKTSGQPLTFFINLDEIGLNLIKRLLSTDYFPSSVSIFSKVGYYISKLNNFDTQKNKDFAIKSLKSNPLSDVQVRRKVFDYFKYRRVYIAINSGARIPSFRGMEDYINVESRHPLISYFIHLVSEIQYEEEVFKAIVTIFKSVDGSRGSLDSLLRSIRVTIDSLEFNSLFVKEDQSYKVVNYGQALNKESQGSEVYSGTIDWQTFTKSKGQYESLITPVSLLAPYRKTVLNLDKKIKGLQTKTLTPEVPNSYNRDIPHKCYWNAI